MASKLGAALAPVALRSLFISHGGGPCFFMDGAGGPFKEMDQNSKVAAEMRELAATWEKPEAIVLVSAHWEAEPGTPVRVTSGLAPKLIYDYFGFPEHTYSLEYPAPGHPELAAAAVEALNKEGVTAVADPTRGFDHGVFIPLKMIYPSADIPIVAVSLAGSLDPATHVKIGKALATLRETFKGLLVVGSGMATHNLGAMRRSGTGPDDPRSVEFIQWLKDTMKGGSVSGEERLRRLVDWESTAPQARFAHPREEHLLPLQVALGAAGPDRDPELVLDATLLGGLSMASYAFRE